MVENIKRIPEKLILREFSLTADISPNTETAVVAWHREGTLQQKIKACSIRGCKYLQKEILIPGCCIWDLQVFKSSPRESTSLSTGKSADKSDKLPPSDRLLILRNFLQST